MDTIQEDARAIRWNSAFVGIAFIVATAAGAVAAAIGSPILDAPDYLSRLAVNEGTVGLVARFTFLMSVACAGVGLGPYGFGTVQIKGGDR